MEQDDRPFSEEAQTEAPGRADGGGPAERPLPDILDADRYEFGALLGRGGMGEVLGAVDPVLGRRLAFKRVLPDRELGPDALSGFVREARITAQLAHPNIVPVHELARDAHGNPYYTMKRIEGKSLSELLRDQKREAAPAPTSSSARLPSLRADRQRLSGSLQVFLKVCDAVGFAHSRGVIHRDLKPANVMVGEFGEVLVVDWGLAKVLDEPGTEEEAASHARLMESSAEHRTLDGTVKGTPAYMPPEQADGRIGKLDARSDIYSLGAILYQILTLEAPFQAGSPAKILEAVRRGALVPPRRRRPDRTIPWELEAIVLKAMAPSPGDRYETVAELTAEIEAFLEGRLVGAASYSALTAAGKWVGRNRQLLTAVACGIALLTALGAGALRWREQARRQEQLRDRRLEAERAWSAGKLEPALLAARRGLDLDADDPTLSSIRRRAEAALAKQVSTRRRRQQLNEELATVDQELRAVELLSYVGGIDLERHRERVEEVLARLRGLVEAAPYAEFPEAALRLGRALHFLGRNRQGERALAVARARGATEARVAPLAGELALARAWSSALTHDRDGYREQIKRAQRWFGLSPWAAPGREASLQQSLQQALRLYVADKPEAARAAAREALERFDRTLGAEQLSVVEGLTLLRHQHAKENEQVIAAASRALRLRPHYALGYQLRGHALLHQRKLTEALADFERWVRLEPAEASAYLYRGLVHDRCGRDAPARADYERATKLQPQNAQAWFNLGSLHRVARRDLLAIACFTQVLRLRPGAAAAYVCRGVVRMNRKEYDKALVDFGLAIKVNPNYALGYHNRGIIRRSRGQFDAALADLNRAAKLDPASAMTYFHRGIVHWNRQDLDAALADFEKVIELDQRNWRARINRGQVLIQKGRRAEGLAAMRGALRVAPRSAHAKIRKWIAEEQR